MSLGISGQFPTVYSKQDVNWLVNFIIQNGDPKTLNRYHISKFHNKWVDVDTCLKNMTNYIGEDFEFENIIYIDWIDKIDTEIHNDLSHKYSTLPIGKNRSLDLNYRIYYTFLFVQDIVRNFGDHNPNTVIFEQVNYESVSFDVSDGIPDWDEVYDVPQEVEHQLSQIPIEILRKFKFHSIIEQNYENINYWSSANYHCANNFTKFGVHRKKFLVAMASKPLVY